LVAGLVYNTVMTKILFLGGPSGSGKSHICKEYLSPKKGWLHLEIDQFLKDGIDEHQLRDEWDDYYHRLKPERLHKELLRRAATAEYVVLSFSGNMVFSQDHLWAGRHCFSFAYLYGLPAHCLKAFLEREERLSRGLGKDHWDTHNQIAYGLLSKSTNHPLLIDVFNSTGKRRSLQQIYSNILHLINK
jgi:hypothetical protein